MENGIIIELGVLNCPPLANGGILTIVSWPAGDNIYKNFVRIRSTWAHKLQNEVFNIFMYKYKSRYTYRRKQVLYNFLTFKIYLLSLFYAFSFNQKIHTYVLMRFNK